MLDQTLTLPEDPEELRSFTARLLAEVKAQAILIEKLRHQLAGHRAHRFGASSETAEQLQLALETSEIAASAMMARMKLPDIEEKDKPKRRPIPDHIPRMEVELTPGTDACADCGGRLRRIGEDVTEELEYVPGRFIVNRIVRPRLTCTCCERFSQAPLPSRPIERGRPGPGLLAHVLVSKYADHLPLYRQSQIFDREGLDLDRSTLADWVGKSTALLEPLADAIGRHVLSAQAIFADDTPISMLAPGTGKTQTARLWTYARDERPWGGEAPPAAWYRFSGDRKGQHPKDHLARYRGWMHADGYAGFEDLYRSGTIRELACMAARHCPRTNGGQWLAPAEVRRHPPVTRLPDCRRGYRQDRPALCRRETGPRLPARSPCRTATRARRPRLRRSGTMAGHATHHDLGQIPAGRSNPIRSDPHGAPAPLPRPRYPILAHGWQIPSPASRTTRSQRSTTCSHGAGTDSGQTGRLQTARGFGALSKAAKEQGVLDVKTKEFVALGIAVSQRCEACIGFHIEALIKAGGTREELGDVLTMAVQMGGGPALMYAAKAFECWDELADG